ncbi:MAG TPA: SDR family oxidoreductase [Coriobacteriia bacterium]|nr:SDR family oxidoreductase [Coriobacteriia bacterium]
MTTETVLVTGGAGFIGSNIVDGLLADGGYRVRVLDNFATGRRENLTHCLERIDVIEGDIRDLETVEEAVRGVDMILHQAALPSVPRSVKAPVTTNDVNVGGTLKLLSAAHRAGVRRVVLASSSSVYGDGEQLPKHEAMTPAPRSPYAVSKLACEHYTRVFADIYDMETLAIRYFNVFGPRQDPTSQYAGVIARFMTAALDEKPYLVHGDGTQARDFTYVDNVVAANMLALKSGRLDGSALNVACGDRTSLLDVIETLRSLTGRSGEVAFSEPRVGDVRYSQAAIDRAAQVLGYTPIVPFAEGLRRTFEWYAANRPDRRGL